MSHHPRAKSITNPMDVVSTPGMTLAPAPGRGAQDGFNAFGDDGLTFCDVIDLINPLHHLPVVGNIYRKITGDVIAPALRIAGGALFGGPLGAAFVAASVILKEAVEIAGETIRGATPEPMPLERGRGGWMVAETRRGNPTAPMALAAALERPITPSPDLQVAIPDRPHQPQRRGGWMAAAAYTMADANLQQAAPAIDTLA